MHLLFFQEALRVFPHTLKIDFENYFRELFDSAGMAEQDTHVAICQHLCCKVKDSDDKVLCVHRIFFCMECLHTCDPLNEHGPRFYRWERQAAQGPTARKWQSQAQSPLSDALLTVPWRFLPGESSQKALHPSPSWGNQGQNKQNHKSQSNFFVFPFDIRL